MSTTKEDPAARLEKIIREAKDLPTLPSIVSKTLELMEDPRASMRDIGDVVSSDQATTSKLMRLVNSAYYGFPRRISTISQALVVIGVEGLRSLLMGTSMKALFKNEEAKTLWSHSVLTAAAAKILTQKFGAIHPEESFVVGLIHDIGRLILCLHFPEEFTAGGFLTKDSGPTLREEREIFGKDHGEIGGCVASNWNLPQKIVDAIRYHHKPNMVEQNQAALITCLSDEIALFVATLKEKGENFRSEKNLMACISSRHLESLNIRKFPLEMIDDIELKAKELMDVFGDL